MEARLSMGRDLIGCRWGFLEEQRDACAVVTRRMEVLYLNTAAMSLVPSEWFGSRCWEVFPVADGACAAKCPAVRAVSEAEDVVYCEEVIFTADGSPVRLGIAILPVPSLAEAGERAILLLRPMSSQEPQEAFRRDLIQDARTLHATLGRRFRQPSRSRR